MIIEIHLRLYNMEFSIVIWTALKDMHTEILNLISHLVQHNCKTGMVPLIMSLIQNIHTAIFNYHGVCNFWNSLYLKLTEINAVCFFPTWDIVNLYLYTMAVVKTWVRQARLPAREQTCQAASLTTDNH